MMKHRIRRNEHGDPVLTITVEGMHDVYRMGFYLQRAAVEHAAMGRSIHRSIRRRVGKDGWAWMQRYFHGDGGYR